MFNAQEQEIIKSAQQIILSKLAEPGVALLSPSDVVEFLRLSLGALDREVFGVIYLDNRHCVIAYHEEFQGTLNAACVYPREIVKRALKLNAGAVILAHNHPSGHARPSQADKQITERLVKALDLVDTTVLDHLIIAGQAQFSFAGSGLM